MEKKSSISSNTPLSKGQKTKQAILQSALQGFCKHGFDGIGVREIAEKAGVTAMMINRYFGSKEELFSEVCDLAFSQKGILTDEVFELSDNPEKFSESLVMGLLNQTKSDGVTLNGFSLLLRSAGNDKAAKILREKIEMHFEVPLEKSLRGPKRGERAVVLLAIIAGIQLFRQILETKSLAGANATTLTKLLSPVLLSVLSG